MGFDALDFNFSLHQRVSFSNPGRGNEVVPSAQQPLGVSVFAVWSVDFRIVSVCTEPESQQEAKRDMQRSYDRTQHLAGKL